MGYTFRIVNSMKDKIAENISSEIKQKRISLGLTQGQLAKILGVSPNTLARWERGELKPRSIGAILITLDKLHENFTIQKLSPTIAGE